MSADTLLSQLGGVKQTGHGRWIARCPAHSDRKASLSIRELHDGRVLVHDFAGCAVEEVLAAVGLDFDSLFPERPLYHGKPRERRPFNANDVLACLDTEALIVAIAATDIVRSGGISDNDKARVMVAASRIAAARELINGD